MLLALLSRRLRTWVLFSLLMPLVGRLLRSTGGRVSQRNPRVGGAMVKVGDFARVPPRRRTRRS